MKILIIEDEIALAQAITTYLEQEGNICETAIDYEDARLKTEVYEYDCILVDIGLPGGSGLDIIRKLKQERKNAGIIILSAKGSIDDKIVGLDIGSDDYLPKPFHMGELNSRIKSLLRRRHFGGEPIIEFREIKVDPEKQNVLVNAQLVKLTRSEYSLLLYFLANQRRVLTKESVAEHLNGDRAEMLDSIDFIYSHIKNLRKKLVDAGAKDYIQSVYGMGYKWSIT